MPPWVPTFTASCDTSRVTSFPLYLHADVESWLASNPTLRRRADWLFAELAARGVAGRPKGVVGPSREVADLPDHRWRRSGLGGFEYYAWWFEAGAGAPFPLASRVVRAIRPHDEMGILAADDPANYSERPFGSLQPLNDEQQAIVSAAARVRLAVGHPGTGKTGALLYVVVEEAARQPDGLLLYVTLSERLAEEARQFLGGIPALVSRVEVVTYDELLAEWSRERSASRPAALSAAEEERRFLGFVRDQPDADLGPWLKALDALWVEVRAYLVGRALPYRLTARRLPACIQPLLERSTYGALRDGVLNGEARRTAWQLARRFAEAYGNTQQQRAWSVLRALLDGRLDSRLKRYAGLVVDELQDLTLLQLAVLVEATRRLGQLGVVDPCFIAAGDESQVVQPSGFDWGICKNLLSEQLGSDPREFQLTTNQRSPAPLVEVSNRTAALYEVLPKGHRPQAKVEVEKSEASNGRVYYCRVAPDDEALGEWLAAVADAPGSALLTCPGRPPSELAPRAGDARYADLVFEPAVLKGLDRQYVLLWDASLTLEAPRKLVEDAQDDRDPRYLVARRRIDELRVAISRANETLVLVDPADGVTDPLIDGLLADGVAEAARPAHLADELRSRGHDPLETATALFEEARALLESDPERALRSLGRADGALANLRDPDSRREAIALGIETRRAIARQLKARAREQADAAGPDASEAAGATSQQVGDLYRGIARYLEGVSDDDQAAPTRRRLYRALAERYLQPPPGMQRSPRELVTPFADYVEALAELPEQERRESMLDEARGWRDELLGLEVEAPEALARLERSVACLAELSERAEDLEAAGRALVEAARRFLASGQWALADDTLRRLPEAPPDLLARCCEGLGEWSRAAELRLQAGDLAGALHAYRQAGQLDRAAELAAQQGQQPLAEELAYGGRLVAMLASLDPRRLSSLTPAERARIFESLRDAAERLDGWASPRERRHPAERGRR